MLLNLPRLIIRDFIVEDIDAIFKVLSDPAVMRFSLKGPFSKEKTIKYIHDHIRAYSQPGYGQYAIVLKESDAVIGCCGFIDMQFNGGRETEVTYRIAKEYWGKGFASEAVRACKEYAFSQLGLSRLMARIEPENIASIKVAEKAGLQFKQELILHNIPVLLYAVEPF